MSIDSCEVETIKAFVKKQKGDRYVSLLGNPKRRKTFTLSLAHFADFDEKYRINIPPASQTPAGIETLLKARGAGTLCHIISESGSLDGREIILIEALRQVIGYGMGTMLCCVSGRLAYFENEDGRYILEHPLNRKSA